MTPSIRDVAERAGVSVGTVSNVLNAPDKVAPATRERVLAAIGELGFSRNESARQLRAGSSRFVGLIVPDIRNPFFTEAARGLERVASQAGLVVLLCDSDGSEENEDRYLDMLREQRAYGVVITPVSGVRERLRALSEEGTRIVLLAADATGYCSVTVDDTGGAHRAVGHLLATGHRDIVFVSGATPRQARRREGAALAALTVPDAVLRQVRVPRLDIASGHGAAKRVLAMRRPPTAIFCGNDRLAFGVLHGLAEAGVGVPAQMSVVGYDDVDYAVAASTPLTTVRQPSAELGARAIELLLDEDDGEHQHQTVVYGTELVVRQSSAPITPPEGSGGAVAAVDRPLVAPQTPGTAHVPLLPTVQRRGVSR